MGQDLDEWEVGYEVSMIKHEEASGKIWNDRIMRSK